MKTPISTSFGIILALSCLAQTRPEAPRYPAQFTLRVLTDDGQPVVGASVGVSTFDHWVPGEGFGKDIHLQKSGTTGPDGSAVVALPSKDGSFAIGVDSMARYYQDKGIWEYRLNTINNGRWEPWNPEVRIVFKPILNPIPMYARSLGWSSKDFVLPATGRPVGFDLLKGDWVAPHGKGVTADLIFLHEVEIPFIDTMKPFRSTLTISFSAAEDGIQTVMAPPFQGSALRLPRFAPADGYAPRLVKQVGRPSPEQPIKSDIQEDRNYFFRIRSTTDETGKLTSALYGKIYGDIEFFARGQLRFRYCLNPNPMDRNMEFDPKRNLFGNLPNFETFNYP